MAGGRTNEFIPLRTSTQIPPNTVFVDLLQFETEDFENFKWQLRNETPNTNYTWKHFKDTANCFHYIDNQKRQNIILICSGTLGVNFIRDIHNFSQMHSIYIYCRKTSKYEFLKQAYAKVRGIFDNPIELFDKLCTNLDEEARQICATSKFHSELLPKKVEVLLNCLYGSQLRSYYLPNIPWCPWTEQNCTVLLPSKGQGTIEICSKEAVSFTVFLSTKPDGDSYALVWKVEPDEVSVGTISAQHNHALHVEETNKEKYSLDQQQKKRRYWLSFYGSERKARCGLGEIRPKFRILEIELANQEKTQMENILYLRLEVNNSTNENTTEDLQDKMKILIGREPITFEPPLKILSPNDFSSTHPVKNKFVYERLLADPLRSLYDELQSFHLNDPDFSDFIEAIEQSINNENSWCYLKLKEKCKLFGKPATENTYICITIDEIETKKTNYSCLLKIFPAGHCSPIHSHSDAHGILRVLYGKLLIKYFPFLSTNFNQNSPIEGLFEQNEVTWTTPKLNQTQQMKNPCVNGSCCIVLQCYQFRHKAQDCCESFDYVTNNGQNIAHCDYAPDTNYNTLKEILKMEFLPSTNV